MKNKPGLSWGIDAPINLFRTSKGWIAMCYTVEPPVIIEIFSPKNIYQFRNMLEEGAICNYGTCELCPLVKMELDD